MNIKIVFVNLLLLLALFSCESEDVDLSQPFVAAFSSTSYNLGTIRESQEIKVVFSETAASAGVVTIKATAVNAAYKTDYETIPSAENGFFEIPFEAGDTEVAFTYINRIVLPFDEEDNDKAITFDVVKIDYNSQNSIQGQTSTVVSFSVSNGATLFPETGGPNQGNQVFIDLSTELMTTSRRDKWDLGFYNGEQFRVTINGSLYMAAKQLNSDNIDAVTPASVQPYFNQVAIGTFEASNVNYIDAPNGNIAQTAIAEISSTPSDNKVYLVNMGYQIGTDVPPPGSVAIAGNSRGWKKIRILRSGDNYVLQYADLNSTTHTEATIPKKDTHNFRFFSMVTNSEVTVEPEKNKWDLNFTVFTNEIVGSGSYGYSDFVVNNLKGGVKVYRVNNSDPEAFGKFARADIDNSKFTDDQRIIGADWRDVFSGSAATDRFYVLKDVDGYYYKIRMLSFVNPAGVRGYPKFEYKLVQ